MTLIDELFHAMFFSISPVAPGVKILLHFAVFAFSGKQHVGRA